MHRGFWVPEEWQSCGEVCRSSLRSLAETGSHPFCQKWWIVLRCRAPANRDMETWSFVSNWQRPARDDFSQKDRAAQIEGTSGDFWSSLLLRAGKTLNSAQVAQGFGQPNTPNEASLWFFFYMDRFCGELLSFVLTLLLVGTFPLSIYHHYLSCSPINLSLTWDWFSCMCVMWQKFQ